jgi:hypothetical protein
MRLASQHARLWASCHAEGRGFESLHPLLKILESGQFVVLAVNVQESVARFASRDGRAMRERCVCAETKDLRRIALYGTV